MSGLRVRARGPELMDQPRLDPRELARSLDDLRGVNRWLGGTRLALRLLAPALRRVPERPVRVLDVATGSADIPLALARWARAREVRVAVTATDFHPLTVEAARRRAAADPDVRVLPADALHLPFGDRAFHVALCCTALHHFEEADAVQVLREMGRVATHAVVVSDLRRWGPALLGARLLAATVWRRHPITRHDGPLSVRGAFTARELRALAEQAGLERARVRAHPLRVSLVAEREGVR